MRINYLVSHQLPDFLASDYCYDVEMKRAIERHEAGQAHVIPIIIRPCDWHMTPFGKLQALPRDGKPVASWGDRDSAFADVVLGIKRILEHGQTRPSQEKIRTYSVVISAKIAEVDEEKIDKIMKQLREIAGDAEITLRKVEEGSVVLFLEGTQETAEILKYLINNGMLKEVCGCRIKGVGLSPDPPRGSRSQKRRRQGSF